MNIHNVVYPYNRIVSPDKKKKEHSAPTYYNVNKFQKKILCLVKEDRYKRTYFV